MFIVGWMIVLILRANDVVVPGAVSFWVGLAAITEASLYIGSFVFGMGALVWEWLTDRK